MRFLTRKLYSSVAFGTMATENSRPTLRGVVFDMDGTLTIPNIDFADMYRRCGVPKNEDILAAVSSMPRDEAKKANAIIDEFEEDGRQTLRLSRGALELGKWLNGHGIPISLVTRNTAKTVDEMVKNHWLPGGGDAFSPAISRDSIENLPAKPDPAALSLIARKWDISLPSKDLIMVGDSPAHDVEFGRRAGISTVLYSSRHENDDAGGADYCVDELFKLPRILWNNFDIGGDLGTGASLKKYPRPIPKSAASVAAVSGHVESLLSMSLPELQEADEYGNTPLIWAADAGRQNSVEALLSVNGLNVDAKGYLGATAVCRASRQGHADVVRILAMAGNANLDIPNAKMQYPLHFAAFKKKMDVVKVLLEHDANTIVLDRKGRTPDEDTSDETIREEILRKREAYFSSKD